MRSIPSCLDEVDVVWMSKALGVRVAGVRRLPSPRGFGATSQVGRFALTGDGPSTVVVKLGRADHAHPSMYIREVRSYRELALPAPRCHHAAVDGDAFVLVLEDLGHAHHPVAGADRDQARAMLAVLGSWHRANRGEDWPTKSLPDPSAHRDRVRVGLERLDRRRFAVTPETERALDALLDDLPGALACLAISARGLVHGDLHAENVLIDGDHVVFVDWQNTSWGPLAIDLAGALTCIAPAVLEANGDALIDGYHTVAGTPRDDAALRGAVGLVCYAIPWLADQAATSDRAPSTSNGHWARLAAAIRLVWGGAR